MESERKNDSHKRHCRESGFVLGIPGDPRQVFRDVLDAVRRRQNA